MTEDHTGTVPGDWSGKQWQEHCLRLLRIRYRDGLQEVPDADQGDWGIEAYTLDGVVFQCYSPKEYLAARKRYEKHRDKITRDLNKLRDNAASFERLFACSPVKRYIFMVPRHETKLLLEHVGGKAAEVRGWQLPFISSGFSIVVLTDDNFDLEKRQAYSLPVPLIGLDDYRADGEQAAGWAETNEDLLAQARRKMQDLGLRGEALRDYLDVLVRLHLTGENALGELRARFPDEWAAVSCAKSRREGMLALEHPVGSFGGAKDVVPVAEGLSRELAEAAPSVGHLAKDLAWAAVADWIMRCPLEFEGCA